jgi:hypothetical protein
LVKEWQQLTPIPPIPSPEKAISFQFGSRDERHARDELTLLEKIALRA